MVQKGEVVTVRGNIVLHNDFGYAYSYKLLMEDVQLVDRSDAGHLPCCERA